MPNSLPYDVEKTLDAEFNNILRIIKNHIETVTNTYYLTLYRLWLEKLNEIDSNQKDERNRYLIELCRQIQNVRLEYPFSHPPGPGPLQRFPYDFLNDQVPKVSNNVFQNDDTKKSSSFTNNISTKQDIAENIFDSESRTLRIPALTLVGGDALPIERSLLEYEYREPFNRCHGDTEKWDLNKSVKNSRSSKLRKAKTGNCSMQNPIDFRALQKRTKKSKLTNKQQNDGKRRSDELKIGLVKHPPKEFVRTYKSPKSDGSWTDVADLINVNDSDFAERSPTTVCLKQTETLVNCRKAVQNAISAASELRKVNLESREEISEADRLLNFNLENVQTSSGCMESEIKLLKSRLEELVSLKETMKDSMKDITSQWDNTVHNLKEEIQTAKEQSSELRLQIRELYQKLDVQFQLTGCLNQKLTIEHQNQIEVVKDDQLKRFQCLEEKFDQILKEKEDKLMEKLNLVKEAYESKTSEISKEYERCIDQKSFEIQTLKVSLENQFIRMNKEICEIKNQIGQSSNNNDREEKIDSLENRLWRIDGLYKTIEKKYNRRIRKLQQKMLLKDKVIQLQLTTQKAEIITTVSSKTQIEIDSTISSLEQKYKKLLENQRDQFLMEKQCDSNLIIGLTTLITGNV